MRQLDATSVFAECDQKTMIGLSLLLALQSVRTDCDKPRPDFSFLFIVIIYNITSSSHLSGHRHVESLLAEMP